MSATEVPEIVLLVFIMELLAISRISEVLKEHKVCLGDSLRHTKGFKQHKNHLRSVRERETIPG